MPNPSDMLLSSFKKDGQNSECNPRTIRVYSESRGIDSSCSISNGIIEHGNNALQYHLASVGKIFTAIIIGKLVEENKIAFNTKIHECIPEIAAISQNKYIGNTTIFELLSHTSGIPDYYLDKNKEGIRLFDLMTKEPMRFWPPLETVEWAFSELSHLSYKNKAHYSDTNYQILGLIIEKIENMRLADTYKSRIFDKVKMNSTYMPFYTSSNLPSDKIAMLTYKGINLSNAKSISMSWGGGGIVSTTDDQLKFMRALINGEIITPETFEKMKNFKPLSFGIQYGLGLMRFKNFLMPRKFKIIGHSGSIGSFLYYNAAKDTHIILTRY